ncbi:MAG: YceI family protein [Acidimicrobiales bacterium]
MADAYDDDGPGAVSPRTQTDLPTPEPTASGRRRWSSARRLSVGVVVLALAAAGGFAWKQVAPVISARKYAKVTYRVPTAPKLTPGSGETLYRIDPTHSSLTYAVDETFVGRSPSTAKGLTNGIAGDVVVNATDLAKSRLGTVVVNVEQLHSDNNLRDARLRQDYLQSHRFPLAKLKVTTITGLDGRLIEAKSYPFTMKGTVTVKGTEVPATFVGTARVKAGELTAKATTVVKLSDFDAGPIAIAGLVHTADEAKLTLSISALDPTQHTIPTAITGPHATEAKATNAPSYAKVIAPILEANCASCHNTGQSGADNVKIDTAGDARAISDGMKTVTQTRYMPPWPASDKGRRLAHKMTLTKAEIASLAAWSDGGGKLDVPAATKVRPDKKAAEALPRRDVTMRVPSYTGSLKNNNDYRCFVLDPKLTKPMYLTGYTFLADQVQEVHHSQVFHVTAEQRAQAPAVDGKDGKRGWSCYGGPGLRGRSPETVPGRKENHDVGFAGQADLVAGWVPGQSPVVFPQNSGVYLKPGDALIMQLHYHYDDKPTPDQSGLALQLSPVKGSIKALRVVNPLGPVEIPCLPKDQKKPLCDRDTAIAHSPFGGGIEGGLLALCGKTHEQLEARFDGRIARTTCNLRVPEDGTVTGAMGHMHTLGKSLRLTLDPGTPSEQILLDIPRWSFDWQMNYGFEKSLHVKAGQVIRLDCAWDRQADTLREPRYIVFAEGTEDEMCFATYALIPDNQ